MEYRLLPRIIEQEGNAFQHIENRWRPTNLLMVQQVRILLRDIKSRYDKLEAAQEELSSLDRADKYIQYLRKLRIWLRQANYKWKVDQLSFIQAVCNFYIDYAAILRLLKVDKARGKFNVTSPEKKNLPIGPITLNEENLDQESEELGAEL